MFLSAEMELKKLHLGTMSYGADSMDEVAAQLNSAFEASSAADQGEFDTLWRDRVECPCRAQGRRAKVYIYPCTAHYQRPT